MKLRDVKRLQTERPKIKDGDRKSTAFPPLSGEEMMYLQGIVKDPLQGSRSPSTEQQRIIARLMKMRLLNKGADKDGGALYRATPWGVSTAGRRDYVQGNDGTINIVTRKNPHM